MLIGSIDRLNHKMTSYKTRHSSCGNPTGCMEGTRVKVLADLEAWALDDLSFQSCSLRKSVEASANLEHVQGI